MAENPWLVESLEAFSYYCCPECDHKNQSRENFVQHALQNHSNSEEAFSQNQTQNPKNDESSELKSIIQELDGILVKFNEAKKLEHENGDEISETNESFEVKEEIIEDVECELCNEIIPSNWLKHHQEIEHIDVAVKFKPKVQCNNLRIFWFLRFYVKSILRIFEL